MTSPVQHIRNIGIIAHIDAGKTTTTERILYYSGASHRMGNVDDGTTITDFDPDEAKRGITIYSAAITCEWKDHTINIIDTPGHVDFTVEVERSLRVLDGAVVIFSAVEGVEAQSETVWRQADRYNVPRICFINKLDRIGADFERTFNEMKKRLQAHPLAVQIPMGAGSAPNPDALTGIIDLIEMKALYFDQESKGKEVIVEEIPEAFVEQAQEWRQILVDELTLLMSDEEMEAYLETETISTEQIHKTLRQATLDGVLQPTFCGTSLNHIGVQPLLDGVTNYLPCPTDRPPIEGENPNPKKKGVVKRKLSNKEPFCGLVFKIVADQHTDLYFVRVYSGVLKSGSRVLNPRTGKKELISQIWRIQADSREKIETDQIHAGDIAGVIGPKEAATGDTLCDSSQPILLESIAFPETVISMAVEPDSSAERKKLDDTLQRLERQDPTFTTRVSAETGQTIISGMGELHLEVLRDRLLRDFNLKVRVHKPRVSYRETIRHAAEVERDFHRRVGEISHYAKVKIRIEPFKPAEGEESTEVVNKLKHNQLPEHLTDALIQTVRDEAQGGGYLGFPLMKCRFIILNADWREGETNEVAIQEATASAIRQAFDEADTVLLEPIMKVEVVTPSEFEGNIQSDLNSRRAVIVNAEQRGDLRVLEAHAALSQMFGYSTQIRSLSQGRAGYSMEPLKYDEAPPDVLKNMLG